MRPNTRHRYDDRRKYIRMELGCPVVFEEAQSSQKLHGTCINLSAQGMLIETERSFPIGTTLNVMLEPRIHITSALQAILEIVRIEPSPIRGSYRFGGRFKTK